MGGTITATSEVDIGRLPLQTVQSEKKSIALIGLTGEELTQTIDLLHEHWTVVSYPDL